VTTTEASLQHLVSIGLTDADPEIARLLTKELERERGELELIASENFTWPAVFEAVGSVPTNKYAEGYPGRRYYGGCEVVDEIEELAIERAKELFGAEHANVQPHAGAQTNMAVYAATMEPGDTLLALRLDQGGHLTHGHKVNFSGRLYNVVHYGVSPETMTVDYDEVLRLAKESRPKVIVCGGSAYPRIVETDRFRAIADEVGALLLCDMAHFAGLVAAGLVPSPVENCDFVSSTTHKTLAGPRSGFVLCREEHAKALDSAVMPGMQGGPLMHTIAAKATCFRIAMTDAFRSYQAQIRANADAFGEALQEGGLDLVTGGTDTHLLLVDLRSSEWTGKAAEERLAEVNVTVNRNTVPFDERSPFVTSGIRVGTPAMTMRGFDEDDFRETGRIIADALVESPEIDGLRARVAALCEKRPLYPGWRGYTSFR
jgi:glycine hydroxymethyltransferase